MVDKEIEKKLSILKERRSIRKFKADQVPKEILFKLIEFATFAPSATNRQAWRFIIVTSDFFKRKIVDGGGSKLISSAPCGILVAYQRTIRNVEYHDDFQSASACIQNLLLAADAYGLGACWLCTLPTKGYLQRLFKIPEAYTPIAYIILGYPISKKITEVPRKFSLDDIVAEDCFPSGPLPEAQGTKTIFLERFLVWLYRRLQLWLKKWRVNEIIDKRFTKKFEN